MSTNRMNKVLAGTLVLQLLLVGFAWMPRSSGPAEARDLVPADAAQLDKITIYGRTARDEVPEAPTVLVREADGWKIESTFGYPADEKLLQELFDAIDSLQARAPVATQSYSHMALDVADAQHANKFVIEGGGNTTTLLLGAAEGNASHVRVEGDDDVFKVRGFNVVSLPYKATRIFDRDFQKVAVDDVTSMTIQRPGQLPIRLSVGADGWTTEGLPDGRVLDQQKTRAFVQTTLNLRMLEPHGTEVTPEMGFDPGVVVTWTTDEEGTSATHEYRVGNEIPGENGRIYVKTSDVPWVFEVLKGNVQHARERGVDELISDAIDIDGMLDEE